MTSKVESHLREKRQVEALLPISRWKVETASFDLHKLTNPDVAGAGYQEGAQKGFYNVKAYVLDRDGYRCQSRQKVEHDKALQVHHKVHRSQSGTDTPDNLVTLCRMCHADLHAGAFTLSAKPSQTKTSKTKTSQTKTSKTKTSKTKTSKTKTSKTKTSKSKTKDATHIGIVKAQLKERWLFEETFGYETKYKREQILQLPKSHANDAVAICCEDGEKVRLSEVLYLKRHVAAGDYQQTKGAHSEKRIPTGKVFGLRKHDRVRTAKGTGFVKGKRSTGFFALETIEGETLTASVNVKQATTRLAARTTTLIQRKERASSPLAHKGVSAP